MDFTEKDLVSLIQYKIKNDDDVPLCADYLYIDRYKVIFISKYRKDYRICASSGCHFEPLIKLSTFDILFITRDFEEAVCMFRSYIIRTFKLQNVEKELGEIMEKKE